MKILIAGALSMSLALCLGCASEGDDSENAVTKFDSSYREYIEVVCDCEGARNGASKEVCVEARIAESGISACERAALSHPDAAHTLECVAEATLTRADCEAESACGVENECYNEYDANTSNCDLPDSVRVEMDACAPEPFHCVGGGSVDVDAVCDLVEDCADGSDEVPC